MSINISDVVGKLYAESISNLPVYENNIDNGQSISNYDTGNEASDSEPGDIDDGEIVNNNGIYDNNDLDNINISSESEPNENINIASISNINDHNGDNDGDNNIGDSGYQSEPEDDPDMNVASDSEPEENSNNISNNEPEDDPDLASDSEPNRPLIAMPPLSAPPAVASDYDYWYVTDEYGYEGEASIDEFNVLHFTSSYRDNIINKQGELNYGSDPTDNFGYGVTGNIKKVVIDDELRPSSTKWLFGGGTTTYALDKLEEIVNLDKLDTEDVTDMSYMYKNCTLLKTVDMSSFNTSNVENMESMFYECSSLETVNLSSIDTSKVENMESMFYHCTSLESIDLSSLDTSSVTNMSYMFCWLDSLKNITFSDSFDTSNVTDMTNMFCLNPLLESVDLSSFDTSNVTKMRSMFSGDSKLTNINFPNTFTLDKVTDMSYMFSGCSEIADLDISLFKTYADPISITSLFNGCINLTTIHATSDFSNFSGSNVFVGCTSLVGGNGTNYDESKVGIEYAKIDKINQEGYFTDDSITHNIKTEIWNGSERSDDKAIIGIYRGGTNATGYPIEVCANGQEEKLVVIPTEGYSVESIKVSAASGLNGEATFVTKDTFNQPVYTYKYVIPESGLSINEDVNFKVILRHRNVGYWYVTNETGDIGAADISQGYCVLHLTTDLQENIDNTSGMFHFKGIDGLDGLFEEECLWGVIDSITKVTIDKEFHPDYLSNFFHGLSNLTEIENINNFKTEDVENMSYLFDSCGALQNIDLTSWDVSKVTTMDSMFDSCAELVDINLSGWNTENLINMNRMFAGSGINTLDLSFFNTENVTNVNELFYSCTNLTDINLSSWNTEKVTTMVGMFDSCESLESIDISSFITGDDSVDISNMFSYCVNLKTIYVGEGFLNEKLDGSDLFTLCNNLCGGNGTKFNSSSTSVNFAKIDNKDHVGYFTNKNITHNITKEIRHNNVVDNTIASIKIYRGGDNTTDYEITNCAEGQKEKILLKAVSNEYIIEKVEIIGSTSGLNEDATYVSKSVETIPTYTYEYTIPSTGLDTEEDILFRITYGIIGVDMGYWYVTDENGSVGEADLDNYNVLHLTTDNKDTVSKKSGKFTFGDTPNNNFPDIVGKIKKVVLDNVMRPNTTVRLFKNFNGLEFVDMSKMNTENVTDMAEMFYWCESLVNVDLSSFKTGTGQVNLDKMFYYCSNLETIYATDDFDSTKVTGYNIFTTCTNLKGGNGTEFDSNNTGKEYAMVDKYGQPGYFTNKNLYHKIIKETRYNNVINDTMGSFVTNRSGSENIDSPTCVASQEQKILVKPVDGVKIVKVEVVTQSSHIQADAEFVSRDLETPPTYTYKYMVPSEGLQNQEEILFRVIFDYDTKNTGYWYVTNENNVRGEASLGTYNILHFTTDEQATVTKTSGKFTFGKTANLNFPEIADQIKIVTFDKQFTPESTANLFGDNDNSFSNLTEIRNINNLKTNDVINMSQMFYMCGNLASLDLRSFNTSDVSDMNNMFNQCYALTDLDLSSFDTRKVTNMKMMFSYCTGIESLDISSFKTGDSEVDVEGMFEGCSSLETIYATSDFKNEKMNDANVFSGHLSYFGASENLVGGNGTKFIDGNVGKAYAKIDKKGEEGYFTDKSITHKIEKYEGSESLLIYRGGSSPTDYEIKTATDDQEIKIDCGTGNTFKEPGEVRIFEKNNTSNIINPVISENRYLTFNMPLKSTIGDIVIKAGMPIKKLVNGQESDTSGTYDIDKSSAAEGSTITINNIAPGANKEFRSISIKLTDDPYTDVSYTTIEGGYQFTMPAYPVTIDIKFENIYLINKIVGDNGTCDVDKEKGFKDELVSMVCAPNVGYEINTLTVTTVPGGASVEVSQVSNNNYKFSMPDSNVKIEVTYQLRNNMINVISNNCTVEKSVNSGHMNDIATVSIASIDSGYEFVSIEVYYVDNGHNVSITYQEVGDKIYKFVIPGYDVYFKINIRNNGNSGGGGGGRRKSKTYPIAFNNTNSNDAISDNILASKEVAGPGYLRINTIDSPPISYNIVTNLGKEVAELINNNEEIQDAIRIYPLNILALRDNYQIVQKSKNIEDKLELIAKKALEYPTYTLEEKAIAGRQIIYDVKNDKYYREDMSDFIPMLQWVKLYSDNGESNWYYFDEDRKTKKGLCAVNGEYYYFDNTGKMLTGNQKIGDKYYYFEEKKGSDEGKYMPR